MFNWISNGIIAVVFPIMVTRMEEFTFLPFVVVLFCNWLYTYRVVPETKGRTVAEILEAFHGNTPLIRDQSVSNQGDNTKSSENPEGLWQQYDHSNGDDEDVNVPLREPEE